MSHKTNQGQSAHGAAIDAASWNSLLLWARRMRGSQWDYATARYQVEKGSFEYYAGVEEAPVSREPTPEDSRMMDSDDDGSEYEEPEEKHRHSRSRNSQRHQAQPQQPRYTNHTPAPAAPQPQTVNPIQVLQAPFQNQQQPQQQQQQQQPSYGLTPEQIQYIRWLQSLTPQQQAAVRAQAQQRALGMQQGFQPPR